MYYIINKFYNKGNVAIIRHFNRIGMADLSLSVGKWMCNSVHLFGSALITVRQCALRSREALQKHSVSIVKASAHQCECVAAQRLRRSQQIALLYSRIWDHAALRALVQSMRSQLAKRSRQILIGATGISVFDWEKEKISDHELRRHSSAVTDAYELKNLTVTCPSCKLRLKIDRELATVEYCKCPGTTSVYDKKTLGTDWLPFIERPDVLVWRKEDPATKGMYVYKVFAVYNDVTAYDFLHVQLDAEYRKQWDKTAVELRIIEKHSKSDSEIVYWEMLWPRLFANRDYVFNRRHMVDHKRKVMVIVNRGTEHPSIPPRPGNHRVVDYWSYMVIRPINNFDEPGIEFVLTYFDNPGLSIPSSVSSWVARSGLPDFLNRLRKAAKVLIDLRQQGPSPTIGLQPLPCCNPSERAQSDMPETSNYLNTFQGKNPVYA